MNPVGTTSLGGYDIVNSRFRQFERRSQRKGSPVARYEAEEERLLKPGGVLKIPVGGHSGKEDKCSDCFC